MTVLIVAILAAASAMILGEFRDADVMVNSATATNESVALTNNTAASLTHPLAQSITRIGNNTHTLTSGTNYTSVLVGEADYSTVTVTFLDYTVAGTYDVSYTYDAKSTAYNATDDGLGATTDVTGWLGIVVIIVIAVFIIFLVRQLGASSA